MITIESIKKLGLFITWKLLYIATYEKQFKEEDAIKYAIEKLEEGDDRRWIKVREWANKVLGMRVTGKWGLLSK